MLANVGSVVGQGGFYCVRPGERFAALWLRQLGQDVVSIRYRAGAQAQGNGLLFLFRGLLPRLVSRLELGFGPVRGGDCVGVSH